MSEQTPSDSPETEPAEAPAEDEAEDTTTPSTLRVDNPLSRPTDAVARPGFRNPSNKRSKAQKGRRNKKKRRK